MELDRSSSNSRDDATVAAFYARVVHRVCTGFRERDPTGNADVVALLEQQWRDRIECYTGVPVPAHSDARLTDADADVRSDARADAGADAGDRPHTRDQTRYAQTHITGAPGSQQHAMSHHIAAPGTQPRSIFAQILGEKRKLNQLDGEDDVDDDDEGASDPRPHQRQDDAAEVAAPSGALSDDDDETARSQLNSALTTPSNEVAAVLAPVWGLPVSAFPTQLSSQYVQFRYRTKQRDFLGRVTSVVLTLTRVLEPRDAVRPGHLLWLVDSDVFAATESKGGVVEVVRLGSEQRDDVVVKLPDGATLSVHRARVQRFYERIVKTGTLHIAA